MNALVDSARTFLGVPFKHRGRTRKGMDCAGLVWAAYDALGVVLPDFRLYGPEPHNDGLVKHVAAALGDPLPLATMAPGDVLVMRFEVEPHHIAIVGEKAYDGQLVKTIIHACGWANRVVEQRLVQDMKARVTHVFRRPV